MFQLTKTTKRKLTTAYVEEFTTTPPSPGERQLNQAHVDYLKEKLVNGEFYSPRWALAYCNGKPYRINGQHSSMMLANLNGEFPKNMEVVVDEFQCDTMMDVAQLFNQFDNPVSQRTVAEAVTAHASVHKQLADIRATYISRAVSGIALFQNNCRSAHLTHDVRTNLLHANVAYIVWAFPFLKQARLYSKTGVMAAMYATYLKNQDKAAEFWGLVHDESHPDPKHSTRILSAFLRETLGGSRTKQMKWPVKAFFAKSLHAWNAWRSGEKTSLAYYSDSELPVAK